MKKLNNLLSFNDFSGKLPSNEQKKTKRTDVGLDILKEEINLGKFKEQSYFTDEEKNMLEKSDFDVNGNIANGNEGDIDIKIEKEIIDDGSIKSHENFKYKLSLTYNDIELNSIPISRPTLRSTLIYLMKHIQEYIETVDSYKRDKRMYDKSSKIKRFLTQKPTLEEEDEEYPL